MLIFDELKKNDPQLRFVAAALAGGFFILMAGLWWVQIVSAGEYQSHLETQSYRTIRIPAMLTVPDIHEFASGLLASAA